MLYLQTCLIGVALLMIPLLSRFHGRGKGWRVFRVMLLVVMADLIFETATWLLNGRSFPGAYSCIYMANLLTILFQPVIGVLWLYYVAYRLGLENRVGRAFRVISLAPLIINAALLLTNHWTSFVFTIENGLFTRGRLFWVDVFVSFLYPVIATALALRGARGESDPSRRRECLTLSAFLILPVLGAVIQLVFYGTFLFLIGFALSLLIIFVNIQNDQITLDFLTRTHSRASLMCEYERRAKAVVPTRLLFVFIVDVDGFKRFNDELGHVVGDRVLAEVALRLKLACDSKSCFLSRLGGDEFGILLSAEDEAAAARLAENIHGRFLESARLSGVPLPVTVSLGYARCLSPQETIDEVIRRADEKMYAEKETHPYHSRAR